MSKKKSRDTKPQPKTAAYDKLGWVRSQLEYAYKLVNERLDPRLQRNAIQLTARYLKDWRQHKVKDENGKMDHERAILGLEAYLFQQSPVRVFEQFRALNWNKDILKQTLGLSATTEVTELLESSLIVPNTLTVAVVLALISIQSDIPGACPLPRVYFDLSRDSVSGWMLKENIIRRSRGTCSITGKENIPTTFAISKKVKGNQSVIEISSQLMKEQLDWKPDKKIQVVAIKQIGLPILASCPVCVLRRAHRPKDSDPNVPAFPIPSSELTDKEALYAIGNPLYTGQRVLTYAYLKIFTDRNGKLHKVIRRQCPSCVTVAIKEPAGFHAFIQELKVRRNGLVTDLMVKEWRAEVDELTELRYQTRSETDVMINGVEDSNDLSGLEKKPFSTKVYLTFAVHCEKDSPGLLESVCSFKTSKKNGQLYASLLPNVKVDTLIEALRIFDYLPENLEM